MRLPMLEIDAEVIKRKLVSNLFYQLMWHLVIIVNALVELSEQGSTDHLRHVPIGL